MIQNSLCNEYFSCESCSDVYKETARFSAIDFLSVISSLAIFKLLGKESFAL